MLKQLKKQFESEKKDKNIFDIIIYGSSVKGKTKARDIDVLVIFLDGSLRERLDKIQDIKGKVRNKTENVDIKQIMLTELFSSDFFARTGVLLEGVSIFKGKKFSEILGFKGFTLFWYNLSNLNHTQKVKFNYILSGRGESKGMIKELNGERLVNGAIKIPIENSLEFEEIIRKNNIDYKKKNVLEES